MTNEWKFFVLGRDKTPLPNCPRCAFASSTAERHDAETCECLTCHGFYAGTSDPDKHAWMLRAHPGNPWAVRTGSASGIVVLDFEVDGLATYDEWESWVGADWRPPADTLVASTPSGGRHYYYAYPPSVKIRSRNRVLPGLDVKADGGYVVVPFQQESGRVWLRPQQPLPIVGQFLEWLATARGSGATGTSSGHALGYDFHRFEKDGCPGGVRDEFFNDLIFRSRKQGMSYEDTWFRAHDAWERVQQPPEAQWFMPWEHVSYKLQRIFATVTPNETPAWQKQWAAGLQEREQNETGWPTGKRGRVTIA